MVRDNIICLSAAESASIQHIFPCCRSVDLGIRSVSGRVTDHSRGWRTWHVHCTVINVPFIYFFRVTNSSDMFRSAIEGTAVLRTCCSKVVSTRRHRSISNLAERVHQRSSLSLSFRIMLEQHNLGRTPDWSLLGQHQLCMFRHNTA